MPDNIAGQTRTAAVTSDSPGGNGRIAYDATAIVATDDTNVDTGFQPAYVRWVNTNGVMIEWFDGMAANTCIKTAITGARTLESANGGITVHSRGFRVRQNATLAAVVASQTVYYVALP